MRAISSPPRTSTPIEEMKLDPATYYRMLGRIIEEAPNIPPNKPLSPDARKWLGRVDALVLQSGDIADRMDLRVAMGFIETNREYGMSAVFSVLYRVLAAAELKAPPSERGAFIPVGSGFDAFAALGRILSEAKTDVFIIDPYLDETALTDFAVAVPQGVPLRLLADDNGFKPTLAPAVKRWIAQHGSARPLSARLAPARSLHDRAILVDGGQAWTLTQSLAHFAQRSPAEIVNVGGELAALKIVAYEKIWSGAKTL